MKQLIIAALLLIGISAKAQSVSGIDTLTNAGTKNMQTSSNYFNTSEGTWTASLTATKISGTTAGWAVLQASVDGTNFTPLRGNSTDSFALTNVAVQSKNWFISGVKPKLVRVNVIGSGTQSTQLIVYYIKNQN